MIHSMVAAVDSTDSSNQAQAHTMQLAKRFNAKVTGIAVLDTPWIKRPMAMPIGGGSYRTHRDETPIAACDAELDEKINEFSGLFSSTGVDCRSIEVTGSPAELLYHEAEQHDLMVMGRDTNFHGVRGHDIGDATERLLDLYDGDLRVMREEADGDLASLRASLIRFKGIGEVGADIFLREAQLAWPDLHPFADARALKVAKKLRIPGSAAGLAELVPPKDLPRLLDALVRIDLAHEVDEVSRAA